MFLRLCNASFRLRVSAPLGVAHTSELGWQAGNVVFLSCNASASFKVYLWGKKPQIQCNLKHFGSVAVGYSEPVALGKYAQVHHVNGTVNKAFKPTREACGLMRRYASEPISLVLQDIS